MLYVGWDVMWVDFLHTNPNRSHLNALIMPLVFGVVGGIWLTVDMLSALVCGLHSRRERGFETHAWKR